MQTIRYELLDAAGGKVALVTFDEAGSPVNTMCRQWQDDLIALVAQVQRDREVLKGIVLASAKTSFFAGADLKATMRGTAADALWPIHAGMPRRTSAGPDTARLPSSSACCQLMSPRQMRVSVRRLVSTVPATS